MGYRKRDEYLSLQSSKDVWYFEGDFTKATTAKARAIITSSIGHDDSLLCNIASPRLMLAAMTAPNSISTSQANEHHSHPSQVERRLVVLHGSVHHPVELKTSCNAAPSSV